MTDDTSTAPAPPDTAAAPGEDDGPPEEATAAPTGRRRALLLAGMVALVVLPLLVALGVVRQPRWYPQSDLAMTELRVRDVGSDNPPLTGLGGRIGPAGIDAGSHPGPLSFWSLAPAYRLLGSSTWALQVATAVLHAVAMGLTLWMARRRGGAPVLVAMTAALLVLVTCFTFEVLTVPWNPYMPVLWWVTALVAVWSLLDGDLATLPVAVFAISFCTQTHISYAGLGATLAALGGAAVAAWLFLRRSDRPALLSGLRWTGISAALGALLWFPPVAEQVTGSQGHNLGIIYRHFRHPDIPPAGIGDGSDYFFSVLNPGTLLTGHAVGGPPFLGASPTPGLVLAGVWLVAAVVAVGLRQRALLLLHGLLGVVVVVGLLSATRIFGLPFEYLALWGWSIGALLLLAIGWTAVAVGARLLAGRPGHIPSLRTGTATVVVAALLVGGLAVRATAEAAEVKTAQERLSPSLAVLADETGAALAAGRLPGTGRDGRYLYTWFDTWNQLARAYSLFNELDRQGYDVGADAVFRQSLTRHRVRTAAEATAQIHLAAGHDVDLWDDIPGAERIASYDPATPAERAEFDRLEAEVRAEAEAIGLADAVKTLAHNPFALWRPVFGTEPILSRAGQAKVGRMIEIGQPAAVFVAPPDARPDSY